MMRGYKIPKKISGLSSELPARPLRWKIWVALTILRIAGLSREPSLYTGSIGDTHDKLPYRYVAMFRPCFLVSVFNWLESLHI